MKRFLVPLDASPNSLAALDVAAEMASRQRGEIIGLFVEDSDLLRYTEHGFASELSLCSCRLRPLQRGELELQLRARAERIRRALADAGNKWGVPWRLHISRGAVRSEIQRAALESDLTVLGKAGWSQVLSGRTGSTVQALISGPGGPTLILQQGARIRPTVFTIYTGTPLSEWTLSAIPELLQLERLRIIVYIPTDSREDFERLRRGAAALLPAGARAEFRTLSSPYSAQLLRELARGESPGTVILPSEAPEFQGRPLRELLNGVSLPVLLIRRVSGGTGKEANDREHGSASGE